MDDTEKAPDPVKRKILPRRPEHYPPLVKVDPAPEGTLAAFEGVVMVIDRPSPPTGNVLARVDAERIVGLVQESVKARRFFGTVDRDKGFKESRLSDATHFVDDLRIDGDRIHVRICLFGTSIGQAVFQMFEAGNDIIPNFTIIAKCGATLPDGSRPLIDVTELIAVDILVYKPGSQTERVRVLPPPVAA